MVEAVVGDVDDVGGGVDEEGDVGDEVEERNFEGMKEESMTQPHRRLSRCPR